MIEASYAVTPEEFAEAQKMWSSENQRKLPGGQLMMIAYLFLGTAIGWSVVDLPRPLAIYLFLAFIAVVCVPYWRRTAIRKYVYAQATDRHEPVQLRIDENGYSTVRPEFNECHMRWRCFTGWKEGKQVIVLGRGIQMCIVPKKALDQTQIEELVHLLRTHLPNA